MDVAHWIPVGHRYLAHRAEPLVHERLWGNSAPLPDEILAQTTQWQPEAGLDASGQPVAFRIQGEDGVDRVERKGRTVTVHLREGGTATTHFGSTGQPERTEYIEVDGSSGEEVYTYDEAGRLVVIDESELFGVTAFSDRWNFGGRLSVEYDEAGPTRIVGAGDVTVWARPGRAWAAVLTATADRIAAEFREQIREAISKADLTPAAETYGLMLTYVSQGSLDATISIGLEAERRGFGDDENGAVLTLYIEGELEPIYGVPADDDARTVLRVASTEQPDDSYRVVLGEVARRLAAADLPGLAKTEDFVAWVAEHDEGLSEKVSSIRLHNAPEAVARWERGWGAKVLPFAAG